MKNYFIVIIFILFFFFLSINIQASSPIPLDNPINARNFPEFLGWSSRVLFWFSVIFLPLGIIAGGFLYLTSAANPNTVTLAKKIILYCVVLSGTTMIIHWMIMLLAGEITFTSLLWLKKLLV